MSLSALHRPASLGSFVPPVPQPLRSQPPLLDLLARLRRNPLEVWQERHFREPVSVHRLPLGRIVVASDPGAIRHVLMDNAANYRKDTLQLRVLGTALRSGILTAEGDDWRAQRRLLAPVFAKRTVVSFAPAMQRACDDMVRHLPAGPVRLAPQVNRLTLDMLQRTIFSGGLGANSQGVLDAMQAYFDAIGQIDPFDILGLPDVVPRLSRWRARPALRFFDAAIDRLVAARSQAGASQTDDLLGLLLAARDPDTGAALTRSQVKANVLTFIAAGNETAANAMCWVLFLLAQAPDWQEAVRHEARSAAALPAGERASAMPLTRMVLDEALRLYPPIIAISRQAHADDEVAGVAVRRNDMVVVSPYLVHRHEAIWTDPALFDPTRFDGESRGSIDRCAFIPFGIGPRTCIGGSFALQAALLGVSSILRHYRVKPAPGIDVQPVLRVTLRPSDDMPLVLEPLERSRRRTDGVRLQTAPAL